MSAGEAVLLVGGALVIIAVMIAVMVRLDRATRRRNERIDELRKAEEGEGLGPNDFEGHGHGYWGSYFRPPGG